MSDAVRHGENGEAKRQGHTQQAETALRKTGRNHGGPTSAEGQPECADGFGCELPAVNLHVFLLSECGSSEPIQKRTLPMDQACLVSTRHNTLQGQNRQTSQ